MHLQTLLPTCKHTMNNRTCRYCNKVQPIENFETANIIKGKHYRRWKCTSCKIHQQGVRRTKIATWLQDYKKKQKCAKCGIDDFRVLHFDHLGDKTHNISNMPGYSIKSIEIEIAKCQVLCANCHAIKTYQDRTTG